MKSYLKYIEFHENRWDKRGLDLASLIASWSKGPRTQVGAAILRPDHTIYSVGYNGAPRGYDDEVFLRLPREEQHKIVIHAEDNAFRNGRWHESCRGYTIYVVGLFPCKDCAEKIRLAQIDRVVAYTPDFAGKSLDWKESAEAGKRILDGDGIETLYLV